MVIQVKVYALLRLRHKDYDSDKGISITTQKDLTIMDLFNKMDINPQEVSMVYVNDKVINGVNHFLKDGDVIKIFPPFPAGG